jgi:hypothetical protein
MLAARPPVNTGFRASPADDAGAGIAAVPQIVDRAAPDESPWAAEQLPRASRTRM